MKKLAFASIIAVSLLVSTGCEKTKKLECSTTQESSVYSMKQVLSATFNGKNLNTIDQTITMSINDKYTAYMDKMVDGIKKQYADYEGKKGLSIDVKQDGTNVIVSMNMEPAKMDKDTLKNLTGTDDYKTETYENSKASLEKSGYTCK